MCASSTEVERVETKAGDQKRRIPPVLGRLFNGLEQGIMAVLTVLIAIVAVLSTWHLVLLASRLLLEGQLDPAKQGALQSVFGTILTVLIALEFKRSLLTGATERGSVVRVRSGVLIAMLATVRRFIILDLAVVQVAGTLVLVAAMVALDVVYWLVRGGDRGLGLQGLGPDRRDRGAPSLDRSA